MYNRYQMMKDTDRQHLVLDCLKKKQQELRSSQCSMLSLRVSLRRSEDSVQFLKADLKGREKKIHLLKQRLLQESTNFIQDYFFHTLHQQLSSTEEKKNCTLRKTLIACDSRVKENETKGGHNIIEER